MQTDAPIKTQDKEIEVITYAYACAQRRLL